MEKKGQQSNLNTPQFLKIRPKKFSELSDKAKELWTSRLNVSDPSKIDKLDPSGYDGDFLTFIARYNLNVTKTFDHFPKLWDKYSEFNSAVAEEYPISPKDRELIIIRTAWLSRAEYIFTRHAMAAFLIDFNVEEIERITKGPDDTGWDEHDSNILRAVDCLRENAFIDEKIWKVLSERYNTDQIIAIMFLVGSYTMLAMAVNTIGVQIEKKHEGYGEFSNKLNRLDKVNAFYKKLNEMKRLYSELNKK